MKNETKTYSGPTYEYEHGIFYPLAGNKSEADYLNQKGREGWLVVSRTISPGNAILVDLLFAREVRTLDDCEQKKSVS